MNKYYYRILFELVSPISIGCGESEESDSDLLLDSRGYPYIPGSSLAGVYRSLFSDDTADRYFGADLTAERVRDSGRKGANQLTESRVSVYDAVLFDPEKSKVVVRDMVALDEYKVAMDGAKFDFQVLEPGVTFVTYLEQSMEAQEEGHVLDEIGWAWQEGKILLGAKTGRGYGRTRVREIRRCSFDLTQKEKGILPGAYGKTAGLQEWLDFLMYDEAAWESDFVSAGIARCLSHCDGDGETQELLGIYRKYGIARKQKLETRILMDLRQAGGISIRQYSTDVGEADYRQMTRQDKAPVIPGTSWAGAFRAQMGRLNPDFARGKALTEEFFGTVKEKEKSASHKTRISFAESVLEGGKWITFTRNAIDRFTGGTINGALYTEKTYYHGTAQLEILCDFTGIGKEALREFANTLSAAIIDLQEGLLSVGGLTSVGHGLFQVTGISVNGVELTWSPENWDAEGLQQSCRALAAAIVGEEEAK